MKSDVVHITGDGNGIEAALSQAEGVAAFKKLDKKDAIHLRLFTEELMGMVQNLTGELESDFWIEAEGSDYQLHLLTQTAMNAAKREKLLIQKRASYTNMMSRICKELCSVSDSENFDDLEEYE